MPKVKVKDSNGEDIRELIRETRFGKREKAELARRRPRNPNEKLVLERWKNERGGNKIGNI